MKSIASIILILVTSVSLAAVGFDPLFHALTGGSDLERDTARIRLISMQTEEVTRFMAEAKARSLTKNRFDVVRAFDVLRRRSDFDAARAAEMKRVLASAPSTRESKDLLEERLALILDAKTGALTAAKIDDELRFAAIKTEPSSRRLARVTALTDAMQTIDAAPTTLQLEALLQNDVFEIRMHAVDWFRIAPPRDIAERSRFLKQALKSSVVQVRERAYRTIASWPATDVRALKKSDVLPMKCGADPSLIIRGACSEIREKAGPQ